MSKKSKKKKKQKKHHHFVETQTHAQNGVNTPTPSTQISTEKSNETNSVKSHNLIKDTELDAKLTYMKQDAKLTIMVAGSLIIGLVILWVLFEHAGLGTHLYRLVHI